MTTRQHNGLPTIYYTDQNHFQQEEKTIWANTWQFIGREENIPESGDYLTASLGKEEIFVVRGSDGKLTAMHNVCTHRGAKLLHGQGKCKRFITCPYHAWSFGLNGELSGAPREKELFPNLDKKQFTLSPAKVDTWGGFVFVNANSEAEESLADYLADIPSFLEQYQYNWNTLREVDRWHYDEEINWKLVVENYVEDYHFKVVHSQGFGKFYDDANIENLPTGRHLRIKVPYKIPERSKALGEFFTSFSTGIPFSPQAYIFPNIMLNPHEKFVSMFRLIPLGVAKTRIEVMIFQSPEQFSDIPYRSEVFRKGFDTFMEEDFSITRHIQRNLHSRAYCVSRFARQHELGVKKFQQTIKEFL